MVNLHRSNIERLASTRRIHRPTRVSELSFEHTVGASARRSANSVRLLRSSNNLAVTSLWQYPTPRRGAAWIVFIKGSLFDTFRQRHEQMTQNPKCGALGYQTNPHRRLQKSPEIHADGGRESHALKRFRCQPSILTERGCLKYWLLINMRAIIASGAIEPGSAAKIASKWLL